MNHYHVMRYRLPRRRTLAPRGLGKQTVRQDGWELALLDMMEDLCRNLQVREAASIESYRKLAEGDPSA